MSICTMYAYTMHNYVQWIIIQILHYTSNLLIIYIHVCTCGMYIMYAGINVLSIAVLCYLFIIQYFSWVVVLIANWQVV